EKGSKKVPNFRPNARLSRSGNGSTAISYKPAARPLERRVLRIGCPCESDPNRDRILIHPKSARAATSLPFPVLRSPHRGHPPMHKPLPAWFDNLAHRRHRKTSDTTRLLFLLLPEREPFGLIPHPPHLGRQLIQGR